MKKKERETERACATRENESQFVDALYSKPLIIKEDD